VPLGMFRVNVYEKPVQKSVGSIMRRGKGGSTIQSTDRSTELSSPQAPLVGEAPMAGQSQP